MITESYRALNAQLHADNELYGTSGHKWAGHVATMADTLGARSILDYGAGKGTLKGKLREPWAGMVREYDPAIPGKDAPPEPADLVICTDVLEHIEPDMLDAVLADLKRLTLGRCFLGADCRPAMKSLADGRNAHLIVRPVGWWLRRIVAHFHPLYFQDLNGEFICLCR